MNTVMEMIERVRAGEAAEDVIAGVTRGAQERRFWGLKRGYRAVFTQMQKDETEDKFERGFKR